MNTAIIIAYDFFYREDDSPWFCSYSTTAIVGGDEVAHGELIQLSELEEFERLRVHASESGFNKEVGYTNPHSGVHGET